MKRFARMTTVLLALGALGAGAGGAGCSKSKETPAKTSAASGSASPAGGNPAADPNAPPGATRVRGQGEPQAAAGRPQVYRTVGAITLDEVKDLFPAIAAARVLEAPAKAAQGERVLAKYCFDRGELREVADRVVAAFSGAGWQNVAPRENPQMTTRMNITGKKDPYILFGQVERGSWPECDAAKGQTYVMVGVHKMEVRQGPPPTVVGPRGPALIRPPVNVTPPAAPERPQSP